MRQNVELIRGLGLGGSETLLASRLRVRAARSDCSLTTVINFRPASDHYVSTVASSARLRNAPSGNPAIGVLFSFLLGFFLWGKTVIGHSPACTVGLKLHRAIFGRRFDLIEVAHNTTYTHAIYLRLGRHLNRFATGCIAVSSEVASSPTTENFRAVRVVLGGVDGVSMRNALASKPAEQLREELSLRPRKDRKLVVSVGSLFPRKNHALTIEAAALTTSLVDFAIAGEGPDRPSLESAIAKNDRGNVELLGQVDDAWRLLAAADLVLHPSIHEGFPVVLMEASLLGVPIMCSEFGGWSDFVRSGSTATLISPDDAPSLARAIDDWAQSHDEDGWTPASRVQADSYWNIDRYEREFDAAVRQLAGADA